MMFMTNDHHYSQSARTPTTTRRSPVSETRTRNHDQLLIILDLTSNDLRCNVGANGTGTDTVAVNAGDAFTFTLDTVSFISTILRDMSHCSDLQFQAVYHQGPVSM